MRSYQCSCWRRWWWWWWWWQALAKTSSPLCICVCVCMCVCNRDVKSKLVINLGDECERTTRSSHCAHITYAPQIFYKALADVGNNRTVQFDGSRVHLMKHNRSAAPKCQRPWRRGANYANSSRTCVRHHRTDHHHQQQQRCRTHSKCAMYILSNLAIVL